ncbi:hypothetical protein BGAL_0105g00040 [Botrytis galanthina]|uniref:Uncharacterized protein n=1 Tax=Botrytis galanthina TaxID=278940 RepID=A0A4S8R2I0_9HELO|nr:hypothetical protein BGAL_0105g00040 [Botrytis galanthina]
MARRPPDDDYLYERLRGPRRGETFSVRFDENPTQIPEIGVHRRRGGEQRHVAERSSSRGIIDDGNDYHDFYNDRRTTRPPSRFVSPSPPPPDITRSRPRSPSTASVNHRRDQATSYYSSAPPPVFFHEGADDKIYLKRAAAREQPYSTRTRSRERRRSRSRSPTRFRYNGSRSSSHERVPNLSSYGGRYGIHESKAAETYIELFDPESEAYSFRLSRHSKNALESELTDDLNSGSSETGVPPLPLQKHKSLIMQRPKIDKIIQSHYNGDGIMGGMHSVNFTIAPGQVGSTVKLPSLLFSWVQFEDSTMDFDSFHSSILNLDGLKEGERLGISRILDLVKRRYHKTLQVSSRTKVGHIVPRLLQESLRDETPSTTFKPRKLTWLCLPYFSLQKYTSSNMKSSSHPPRTLLQARQSMTPKERDLKQAVCHLPDTPAGSCFHISQAWFLILGDSSIISCAGLTTAQMSKDSISMSPFRSDTSNSPMHTLLVSDSGSTLWSFPIGECTTWIDFVKHFFEIWPLKFEFAYDGHVIAPKDWPRIFKRAKSSKVCLDFRLSSKSKRPPAGVLIVPSGSIGGFGKGSQNPEKDGASHKPDFKTSKEDNNTKVSDSKSADALEAAEMNYSDELHVFNWMNTQIDKSITASFTRRSAARNVAIINETLLHDDLQEINDFLLQKTNINERFAYKASPRHTRKKFYDILFEVESKIQTDQSLRATYELQVELANAAEVLFRFFLSPQDLGPTTEEFWGPLYEIIVAMLPYGLIEAARSPENDDLNSVPQRFSDRAWIVDTRDVKQIIDWMALIGKRIEVFKELLSEVPTLERCEIDISEKFPRAWLHVLIALAFTKDMASSWYTHMNLCLDLINEGMKETLQTLSKYQLSEYVVFAPFDLASLITFQLSQDLTGSCPDICTTYVDYMISLESDIDANPINREHQGRITDLKQEISVILETLETQREVIQNALHAQSRSNFQNARLNRVVPDHKYEYKLPTFVEPRTANYRNHERSVYHGDNYGDLEVMTAVPAINQSARDNTRGVQGLLFRESLALIDERIEVFRDINGRAMYLEDWNLRSIDTNKDRQETAVYAFTIVTIIFLPLSTVASILGMNTNDVRNMEVTQWVFWVIAIPITIIIIILVLIWSDEWYNFWAGFKNLWGRKTKQRRVRLPDGYPRPETKSGFAFTPTARASGIYPGHYPPPPGPFLRPRKSRTMFDDVPLPY